MELIEIASSLGYLDQSSFTRAFRTRFQLPPKQFRKLYGQV
ncbi:MAG: helix-turn-helix domain-containing protein [Gammaproteobacteria bacterium]|nr:helix-turn-helix domain-containing protein [Gammaproteobacteria bacterium]